MYLYFVIMIIITKISFEREYLAVRGVWSASHNLQSKMSCNQQPPGQQASLELTWQGTAQSGY